MRKKQNGTYFSFSLRDLFNLPIKYIAPIYIVWSNEDNSLQPEKQEHGKSRKKREVLVRMQKQRVWYTKRKTNYKISVRC